MVITQIPPIWFVFLFVCRNKKQNQKFFVIRLGLIEILVFDVEQHFQHLLENIIVVPVVKRSVQPVCCLKRYLSIDYLLFLV